jgi:hypothetical protein
MFVFCLLHLTSLASRIIPDESPTIQSQGYEAVLSFDNGMTLYFNGEEMTETEWQESMKVKADGIVGNKTLQKAVELNDLDVRKL